MDLDATEPTSSTENDSFDLSSELEWIRDPSIDNISP
jgi:hypothetical protein